jgi:membrane-associated PAP2 superfamily phosphatase
MIMHTSCYQPYRPYQPWQMIGFQVVLLLLMLVIRCAIPRFQRPLYVGPARLLIV